MYIYTAKGLGPFNARTVSRSKDNFGTDIVTGTLPFYSPKGAGHFIYRLFNHDLHDKSKMLNTYATSLPFNVVLVDGDVTLNLKYSAEMFVDGQQQKGELLNYMYYICCVYVY